ncbi:MAG: hypothetical protein VCA55_04845 [Verrucomicrobiales bacterium]
MSFNDSWHIRLRSNTCHESNHPFADGEPFYAAIFRDQAKGEFERRDFCVSAWEERISKTNSPAPYSFWRTTFESAPDDPRKREIVGKESAEAMLRRLIEEDDAKSENARYILAIMLERKKIFRQTDLKENSKARMLFYEHTRSGEAFIVRDPNLKLAEIDAIQEEVSRWLGGDDKGNGTVEPASADSGSESGDNR